VKAPCTTGVQTAQIAIDWLQWTYPAAVPAEDIRKALSGRGEWSALPRGMYGYRQALRRGDLWLLFDGREGMGVHVQASGKGCSQLAIEGTVNDWPAFLGSLLGDQVRFTRVDVALDDHRGVLSLDKIRRCVQRGHFVSRWRKTTELENRERIQAGSEVAGRSVVFGSKHSDGRIHIYDKALEQATADHWVRVELQCRGDRAQALARVVSEQGAGVIPGVIRGYLTFRKPGKHRQRDRWPTLPWWEEFLGDCEKVSLRVASPSGDGEDLKWLWLTAAPALARLVDCYGDGIIPKLVEHGREREAARGSRRRRTA